MTLESPPGAEHDRWVDYWNERFDLLYYQAFDYLVRAVGADARSIVDVGSGGCPYLDWFDWIERRVSIDINKPYASPTVEGLKLDIFKNDVPERFDLCTCLQVLEHVPDAGRFALRLTEFAPTVIVSVPYRWPDGKTKGHVHDPVDLEKLSGWFGRTPNYHLIVEEPLRRIKNKRLLAIYDRDPERRFSASTISGRRRRPPLSPDVSTTMSGS